MPCAAHSLPQVAEIFQPDYGMFEYSDETRSFWFKATSLESSVEFQLVCEGGGGLGESQGMSAWMEGAGVTGALSYRGYMDYLLRGLQASRPLAQPSLP